MVYDGKRNPIFDMVSQQSNQIFSQNPLIKTIANDKNWTVSDINKRPVDARYLLDYHQVRNASLLSDPYPLVTLNELNTNENLQAVNRAYRLSALENRIFMIDIEPKTNDETLLKWAQFPAQYTEVSKNGGLHLLIQVPESLITPENQYLFNEITVIRDGDNNEVEFLFNRHYITFTKRIPLDKPSIVYTENSVEYLRLQALLDHIVYIDKDAKAARALAQEVAVDFQEQNLNMDYINAQLQPRYPDNTTTCIYHTTLGYSNFLERLPKLEDCKNDPSLYEFNTAREFIKQIITTIGSLIHAGTSSITYYEEKDHILSFNENDIIYLAYRYCQETLPYREKHDEYRNNMIWLLYTCSNAYNRVKAWFYEHKDETNFQERKDYDAYAAYYTNQAHKTNVSL